MKSEPQTLGEVCPFILKSSELLEFAAVWCQGTNVSETNAASIFSAIHWEPHLQDTSQPASKHSIACTGSQKLWIWLLTVPMAEYSDKLHLQFVHARYVPIYTNI
jgi:hypothetical protein